MEFLFSAFFLYLISLFTAGPVSVNAIGEVVWAVNCGGDMHVDSNGIRYQKDYLGIGTASDYGKSMPVNRVHPQDFLIYQTERYHTSNFGYDVPIPGDGDFVLLLKFSEVWFAAPNQKVFDVVLNGEHTIIERLDIFSKVGRGTAHDEVIPLKVKDGKLFVKGESSDLYYNKIQVEFIKGERDNPKINAIVLIRGTVDDVPKLDPLPGNDAYPNEEDNFEIPEVNQEEVNKQVNSERNRQKRKSASGPKASDPYASDDTSTMLLPVLIALGAFLPIVFCLCKL